MCECSCLNRRTGQSTKALFSALSKTKGTHVFFVSNTREQAKYQFKRLLEMLDSLDYSYTTNHSHLTITPKYSAKIQFCSKDYIESPSNTRGFTNCFVINDTDNEHLEVHF